MLLFLCLDHCGCVFRRLHQGRQLLRSKILVAERQLVLLRVRETIEGENQLVESNQQRPDICALVGPLDAIIALSQKYGLAFCFDAGILASHPPVSVDDGRSG